MVEWLRFALIVMLVAVDDVLREIGISAIAVKEFFLDRVRWIVVEKARMMWRGSHR